MKLFMKNLIAMAWISLTILLVVCGYKIGRSMGIASTRSEAEKLEKELSGKVQKYDGLIAKEEGKLFKKYPKLKVYLQGENQVNDEYIISFTVNQNWDNVNQHEIKVKMNNERFFEVRPDFDIYFLNEDGFITGEYRENWIINKIKHGETRMANGKVIFRFGEPSYYFVQFSN